MCHQSFQCEHVFKYTSVNLLILSLWSKSILPGQIIISKSLAHSQELRSSIGNNLEVEADSKDGLVCFVLLVSLGWEILEQDSFGHNFEAGLHSICRYSKASTEIWSQGGYLWLNQKHRLLHTLIWPNTIFYNPSQEKPRARKSPHWNPALK